MTPLTLVPLLLDYVVVHELAHLEYRDHTSAFWGLVEDVTVTPTQGPSVFLDRTR